MMQHGRGDDIDVESECLEKWHGVFSFNLLQYDGKFVVGNLVNEVALELHNDVVSGEDRAECVALLSKEAEAVALENQRIVEASFH